jgi:hypothetical protein
VKLFQCNDLAFEMIDGEPFLLADCQEYLNRRWARLAQRLARKRPT